MRFRTVLTVLVAVVLAACGGGASPAASPTAARRGARSASATASATPDLSGMTLTLWQSTGMADSIQNVWRNFEAATGAKIDYIAIPDPFEDGVWSKWLVGDRPDILGFHGDKLNLARLGADKNLLDLSNEAFVGKTKFGLLDRVGRLDGKVYAAFTTFPSVSGVFYNKDVFQKLSLTAPKNWDELMAMCDKITQADPNITPIAAGGGAMWPLQFIAASYMSDEVKAGIEDEINAGTVKFTDPRITAMNKSVLDLKNRGCFEKDLATTQYEDQIARLAAGKAAMAFQGAFLLDDLYSSDGKDKIDKLIGYFPVSAKGTLAFWTTGQTGTYMVPLNKDPAKQAAALEFIRYATGPGYEKFLEDSGDPPVFEGFEASSTVSPVKLELAKFLEAGAEQFFGSTLKYPRGPWHVMLSEMLSGDKTPEDVGKAMQEACSTAAAAAGESPSP